MDSPKWRGSTAYIEPISKLLHSLQLSKQSLAVLTISAAGLRVQTLAPSRTLNGQLFLESGLFATFEYAKSNPETITLTISLQAVVHTLRMFMEWSAPDADAAPSSGATNTRQSIGCFLDYQEGQPFRVSFAHDSMTSTCELTLYDSNGDDPDAALAFDRDSLALQAIIPAPVFATTLRDLDAIGAKDVSFRVTVDPAQLEIRGRGDLATSDFVLPNEPQVLEALAADTDAEFNYDFTSVSKCLEAVKIARRISLRYDIGGVLSIQCLCQFDDQTAYIEYRLLPNA